MNKNYLPFYNSLNQKEKDFWLECSKEELIDHFIANVKNGEVLLNRIDKAIEYIKTQQKIFEDYDIVVDNQLKNILEILGDKENE